MNRRPVCRLVIAWWLTLGIAAFVAAQQPATGLPPLGSFAGGTFDTVDLANLDVHFAIPVFSRAGKGIPFNYSLSYDSLVWVPVNPSGANAWTPVNGNWGWRAVTEAATGYVTYENFDFSQSCPTGPLTYGKTTSTYSGFAYHDPTGALHPFSGVVTVVRITSSSCGAIGTTITPITKAITFDNSGYIVSTNSSSATGPATVNAPGGVTIITPAVGATTGAGSVTDANGNQISIGSNGVITDTLGTTALTVSGTPPGNVTYTYTAPSGVQASVTFVYGTYSVQTCFQVSGITEFPATQEYLVNQVQLPDGSTYQLSYETTTGCGASNKVTGRIASVTLPTGGTITYGYTGSWGMMADGSPGYMTRSLGGGTWQYWRSLRVPNTEQTTVTEEDPAGNVTDMNFSGIYLTSQSVYRGNRTAYLDYSSTCYDGNSSSCSTATVSTSSYISERTIYDSPNYGSLFAKYDYTYDTYGNQTGETDYNFAS